MSLATKEARKLILIFASPFNQKPTDPFGITRAIIHVDKILELKGYMDEDNEMAWDCFYDYEQIKEALLKLKKKAKI